MTRAEYDILSLSELENLLLQMGASEKVVEAAYTAVLDDDNNAVLAYINGDSSALNKYLGVKPFDTDPPPANTEEEQPVSPDENDTTATEQEESKQGDVFSEVAAKMYADGAELQEAFSLFEQAKYNDALDACYEIIDKKGISFPAYLLMSQAFMLMTDWDNWDENQDAFIEAAGNAYDLASSVEEVVEANYQIMHTMKVWDVQQHRIILERMRGNISIDAWKGYLSYQQNSMITFAQIVLGLRLRSHVIELRTKEGLTKDQFFDMCSDVCKARKVPEVFPTDEINARKYFLGSAYFDHIVNEIEENKVASKEYLSEFAPAAIEALYLADMILESSISDNMKNKKLLLTHLHMLVKVKRYALEVTIHPNGATMSLINGDRSDDIAKLKEVYNKIKKLDPSFVVPALPSTYGIAPASSASSASGGGCYIATSVYGSYNCPQVWTLRRFRDNTLASTWYGRVFIRTYYAISPTLVKWFGDTEWFKKLWRGKLDKMVDTLQKQGVESTPYQDRNW